jgi:hypothetical protein
MLGAGDGSFSPPNSALIGGAISIIVADLNGDGNLDVVTTLPASVAVQLGNGDGTLQSATIINNTGGKNPISVAVADFNGDGTLDLAVVNECSAITSGKCTSPGRVGVLAGNGNGTFQAVVPFASGGAFATSVAAADANQDGKIDLVVANACTATGSTCTTGLVGVLLNNFLASVSGQLVSSLNPAVLNDSVTFTATFTSAPAVPDGSPVTFTDGATTLGTSTTVGGVATWTTTFTKTGGHSIKASYTGDLYHRPASRSLTETVNKYPSQTSVTSYPNPSRTFDPVVLTATVTSAEPGGPTGTVTFKAGSVVLGTATLTNGVGGISTMKLNTPGTYTITATYHGDTQSAPSSGTTIQTVN